MGEDDVTQLQTLSALDPRSTYSEAQFGNRSAAFIRQAATAGRPFFAYIGTTGPHLPVMPAPWHRELTEHMNVSAPRTPNFNANGVGKNPRLIEGAPKLDADALPFIDRHMRDRWGALMSIDDVVAELVATLEDAGVLDNTYFLFSRWEPGLGYDKIATRGALFGVDVQLLQVLRFLLISCSDHGYHLGQNRMPDEKVSAAKKGLCHVAATS
jgi:hypothetical protein